MRYTSRKIRYLCWLVSSCEMWRCFADGVREWARMRSRQVGGVPRVCDGMRNRYRNTTCKLTRAVGRGHGAALQSNKSPRHTHHRY
ncbi:hypothetical protein EV127DRAFT_432101 [Xylaria flabelliformis]|nr:hypothetical protein EV127DRAFT_432101 [Xylaria flabelliformis]